jgi:nucleotidyltransferase/DNA polymerase involved in DNA repair
VAGDPKKRTGIILAANYEARAYGVRTAMVVHEALKLHITPQSASSVSPVASPSVSSITSIR